MRFILYTVMPNDNIHSLCEKYGIEIADMIKYNQANYPQLAENFEALVTGMTLNIPKIEIG